MNLFAAFLGLFRGGGENAGDGTSYTVTRGAGGRGGAGEVAVRVKTGERGWPVDGDWLDLDDFIDTVSDGTFHIGQVYEEFPAETVVCKKCKGKKWMVGQGSYYTAIKCVKCKHEICIHSG